MLYLIPNNDILIKIRTLQKAVLKKIGNGDRPRCQNTSQISNGDRPPCPNYPLWAPLEALYQKITPSENAGTDLKAVSSLIIRIEVCPCCKKSSTLHLPLTLTLQDNTTIQTSITLFTELPQETDFDFASLPVPEKLNVFKIAEVSEVSSNTLNIESFVWKKLSN